MSKADIIPEYPTVVHNLKGHRKGITSLAFSNNDKLLASASEDHSIIIWSVHTNITRSYGFKGHTGVVTSVEFSPNGELLASSSIDRTVRLWVPKVSGNCIEFKPHITSVQTVSFSSDGSHLVTGANDKTLKLWNTSRTKLIKCFAGHTNWVRCAKFGKNDQIIASCSDDRTLKIWDARSGKTVFTFKHFKGSGNYLEFNPPGNAVALALNNGGVRIYDITANKMRQNYMIHDNTTHLSWHPNGNYLLTSGKDSLLKIIDVLEGIPLFSARNHISSVNAVTFSNDGKFFASGGVGKEILIWKTNFLDKCDEKENEEINLQKITPKK